MRISFELVLLDRTGVSVKRRKIQFRIILIVAAVVLAIIGYMKYFNGNVFYFTTGFGENTILKVKDITATKAEAEVLFSDSKKQYESFFGKEVWDQTIDGITFEDYAKNQIRSKLIRIKCMNILADERGVVLDRTETANVEKAVKEYMSGISDEQKNKLGVTQDGMTKMFTEFAIAKRLFNDMTSQVKTEVSADQARVITIQYISASSEADINAAKARLDKGESFFYVAREVNGNGEYEYELKRGEMEAVFEETAFDLKTGETSGILHSGEKYYIIKCISDNEKTKTEANKNTIVDNMKLNSFNNTFESYEASLYVNFNEKLWNECKISEAVDASVTFEDIFNSYFN